MREIQGQVSRFAFVRFEQEYRKYKRGPHPFSNPVPRKECAGATSRMTAILATYLLAPLTPLLVTATLPPQAAIGRADPLPGHQVHGIKVDAVDPVALSETPQPGAARAGLDVDAEHALRALCPSIAAWRSAGGRTSALAAAALLLPRPALVTSARCALLGANTPW